MSRPRGERSDARVDVCSPDRSVRIGASARGDVVVRVADLHRHTDGSLARQVRAAARVALAALQHPPRNEPGRNEPGRDEPSRNEAARDGLDRNEPARDGPAQDEPSWAGGSEAHRPEWWWAG